MLVSIHAPAWGATPELIVEHNLEIVSIHAPAWGATARRKGKSVYCNRFNPRARVGRDLLL